MILCVTAGRWRQLPALVIPLDRNGGLPFHRITPGSGSPFLKPHQRNAFCRYLYTGNSSTTAVGMLVIETGTRGSKRLNTKILDRDI